jgi:hypothetical protein
MNLVERHGVMGHIRLGRLPKTLPWQGIVGLLAQSPDDVPAVARATAVAAEARLRSLGRDPVLGYCFWLLTRLAVASRGRDFGGALDRIGIGEPSADSALGFVSQVAEHVRVEVADHQESGPFGELASLALWRTLVETVGQHGRSLFGSSLEDVQHAFRAHATPDRLGTLRGASLPITPRVRCGSSLRRSYPTRFALVVP